MSNLGKKYRDRQNDERRIVYYLKRHKAWIDRILRKVAK